MPDITAARPVGGESIASSWGQQVHDYIEAGGGILARAEVAVVNAGGTTEATAAVIIALPPIVLAAAAVLELEFSCADTRPPASSAGNLQGWFFENGVSIGRCLTIVNPAAATMIVPVRVSQRRSVAAGTYTYQFRSANVSGTGGSYVGGVGGAGVTVPTWMTVRAV